MLSPRTAAGTSCWTAARTPPFRQGQGLTYRDIDAVYVSHLHNDHVGGLEWLGFTRKFDPSCDRPVMYISMFLKSELWNDVLSGGMRSLQGEIADLETYFDVRGVPKNGSFSWEGITFRLVQTIHIMDGTPTCPPSACSSR
jgi:glyoxylase-like metal-dependent hydrolase (beta-lactamase superfamily II)